jgi:DNA-directed RNA polymerase specialized sigma subunit
MDDTYRDALENDTSSTNEKKIINNISSCLLPMIDSLDEQSQRVMKRYLEPHVTQSMIADEL